MNVSEDIIFIDTASLGGWGDGATHGLVTLPRSWQIGYGDIDEEHQSLLDFINEGWRAAEDGGVVCVGKLLPMLSSLQQRLSEHFEHEESLMAKLEYPGLHAHAARHRAALAQLCTVELRLAETAAVDRDILDAMLAALIDDILRADIPFKTFLHESGRIR